MGHLEKCTFETNAAVAKIRIKVTYDDYASILNQYTLNKHLICLK